MWETAVLNAHLCSETKRDLHPLTAFSGLLCTPECICVHRSPYSPDPPVRVEGSREGGAQPQPRSRFSASASRSKTRKPLSAKNLSLPIRPCISNWLKLSEQNFISVTRYFDPIWSCGSDRNIAIYVPVRSAGPDWVEIT